MEQYSGTNYKLKSLCCNKVFEDENWELNCPSKECKPSMIRCIYEQKKFEKLDLPGIYKFANWMPVERVLHGSGSPVTYKSQALAKKLGIDNLYITFSGYWPERGGEMLTGTFKECEAFSVCARRNPKKKDVMVVASAGNTARAFARVCSENKIPLIICIPEDNLSALWFEKPLDKCVKVFATAKGGDYFDAINLSNMVCQLPGFYPEGGAKNVARRDGMGTTVLSAVSEIGTIPDYYFQAIGSGTGAIAAWEANLRFIEDGRFGKNKMKLMLSQNYPFVPIKDAWDAGSRSMLEFDENEAREQSGVILAKVLSNRKPPYSLIGGLYDALSDAGGSLLAVSNEKASAAAELFFTTEGIDIEMAAAVNVGSLVECVENGTIKKDDVVMLNITGCGAQRFKSEHKCNMVKADCILPIVPTLDQVKKAVEQAGL